MSPGLARRQLGPAQLHGCTLVLRPPRFSDFAQWRRLRLHDRKLIEPFWHSSPLTWAERHTERHWVREVLETRAFAREGKRLATVIEIDGRFAGQVEIGSIDPQLRQGEMGIWIDAALARHGFGGLAAGLILDFGFDTLGLERIIAPISPANIAAAAGAMEMGFVPEARMAQHFDVGGQRTDHLLYAVTRAELPPKGFTDMWLERMLDRDDEPPRLGIPILYETPGTAAVLGVSARFRAGQLRRAVQRVLPAVPVSLPLPGYPRARLRSPLVSTGPRSPEGLLFHLEVDGRKAGEARLLDLDLFDRHARMQIRADPARADDGVRLAATRALLDHAVHGLGLFRVYSAIPAGDTESAAVAARAGLLEEGIMRSYIGLDGSRGDHALWAVTAGGEHRA
ncbi:GNAT family N-acetyltransferase [Nocardia sp. NPDC020380]|uniref:GNAT family N-acetyltransferase n=1 Tax=Nocardia sp. NPDC020380 TaxID=3364309 RepID=UPI003789495F